MTMKRDEEIRQEMSKIAGTHPDWSKNYCMRMGFYEGAKWADKTMIDKACEWMEKTLFEICDLSKRLDDIQVVSKHKRKRDLIEDFKRAMEE